MSAREPQSKQHIEESITEHQEKLDALMRGENVNFSVGTIEWERERQDLQAHIDWLEWRIRTFAVY